MIKRVERMRVDGGRISRLAPAVVMALFLGRFLNEWLLRGFAGVLAITILSFIIAAPILSRWPLRKTWPVCLLLIYVIYPQPDPGFALSVALFTLATIVLTLDFKGSKWSIPRRTNHIIALLILVVGFSILYVSTIAPDILPADSGEFQFVAAELGVAHPPGFPLYTILAHLMTRLPFGATAAYKVNLLSAITSVLTLLLVYLSVYKLTDSIVSGFIAALALGTATTFWAQATTANIRSLTGVFTALALYLLIMVTGYTIKAAIPQTISNTGNSSAQKPSNNRKNIILLFLLFGAISLGVTHHGSFIFIAGIFIIFLILIQPQSLAPKRWPILLLAAILGLMPLLYLPIRGAASAIGAPPDLTTLSGFLNHVLARGFRGDLLYFDELWIFWERLKVMGNVFAFQFSDFLLAAFVSGMAIMVWRDRLLALLIGGSIAIFTVIAATYRAPQTVEYMLPVYVLAAVILGYLLGMVIQERSIISATNSRPLWRQMLPPLLIALLFVASLNQLFERYPSYRILHRDTTTRDYGQPLLEKAPENSVILADWHWATPMWYLQEVEGVRRDVEVQFVFPTAEKYAQTWARLISEEIAKGRPVIATHFEEGAYANLPPPEPIEEAFLFSLEPRTTLPARFQPTAGNVGEMIAVKGFEVDKEVVEVGQELVVTVAWWPAIGFQPPQNIFLNLTSPDGQVYAQQNLPALTKDDGLTLTQFRLTPRLDTPAGRYQLILGAYGDDEFDGEGFVATPLASINVSPSSVPPITRNEMDRRAVSTPNAHLIGYDWDNTLPDMPRLYLHWREGQHYKTTIIDSLGDGSLVPEFFGPWGIIERSPEINFDSSTHYIPFGQGIIWTGKILSAEKTLEAGQQVELAQYLTASRPVMRDQIVSVRLVGYEEDGFHWNWWDLEDGVPAMGAIPTLKWIADSQIRDPKWPVISEDAWPDQVVEPLLRIYDAFTGRPLPILDERINQNFQWVPLGKSKIDG